MVRIAALPEVSAAGGAALNASGTVLEPPSSAYGFWGAGYRENGGYNPLNLAMAVGK